ncbi:hypothetical protein BO71DRAFT_422812 [Aspergillus ellipticus CBS 707.79]|uniref:Mitochondrial chaperone BCS1-like ATPase lid domain-containing protein n=1 Tax=Aspergillus ellipticus CBS 707.79 TaxID=1448320 RepID=A0A319CWS4_9EURO|nr:hypothetical protein BO71DRAFT_422812 [Aspergillus ellipticus CBS 707.79]
MYIAELELSRILFLGLRYRENTETGNNTRELSRQQPIYYLLAASSLYWFIYKEYLFRLLYQLYKDSECSILYRRGYFFYGLPGTGKSNLYYILTSITCLNIYTVSLSSKTITGNLLYYLFTSLPSYCISAEGGIILSDLLNIINRISAREGCILIITTNKPEDLDETLKRPGYFIVDPETIEIRCLLKPVFKDLMLERLADLADYFARKIPAGKYSSTQLQEYLIQFKGDPVSAEYNIEDWMQ